MFEDFPSAKDRWDLPTKNQQTKIKKKEIKRKQKEKRKKIFK
jgi:hypothetical protein